MKAPFKRVFWVFLLAVLSADALATNGYFLIGHGIRARGMGGVGIGLIQQSQTATVNPAGFSTFDGAMRVDVDAAIFLPRRRSACCLSEDGVVSGSNVFLIPSLGGFYKFNRKLSIGFGASGAGANTRFEQNFFFDDPSLPGGQADETSGVLGVNLIQMIMAPGLSYKLDKHHTAGASLQIGVQTFRASGLNDAFSRFSEHPDNLTNKGNDWSYGAGVRLGWLSEYFDGRFSFGATYASKVYMTKFDKYKGLFADEGGFDIPENYGLGIAIKPLKDLTIAFDWTRILYSDVPSVGNDTLPISSNPADKDGRLGHRDGPGFGWHDQSVFKVGIAYKVTPKLTVRAGYNYAETPIQEDESLEFNVLAPATTEKHYTIGASYRTSKTHEFSFAYQHAARNKLETEISGDTGLPFSGHVETELYINTVEFGYTYRM